MLICQSLYHHPPAQIHGIVLALYTSSHMPLTSSKIFNCKWKWDSFYLPTFANPYSNKCFQPCAGTRLSALKSTHQCKGRADKMSFSLLARSLFVCVACACCVRVFASVFGVLCVYPPVPLAFPAASFLAVLASPSLLPLPWPYFSFPSFSPRCCLLLACSFPSSKSLRDGCWSEVPRTLLGPSPGVRTYAPILGRPPRTRLLIIMSPFIM